MIIFLKFEYMQAVRENLARPIRALNTKEKRQPVDLDCRLLLGRLIQNLIALENVRAILLQERPGLALLPCFGK